MDYCEICFVVNLVEVVFVMLSMDGIENDCGLWFKVIVFGLLVFYLVVMNCRLFGCLFVVKSLGLVLLSVLMGLLIVI